MAQVDTSIYSNFQPNVRLQTPFEIEAGMQQLRQGRDQNRLAQRQSQEADRVDAERNALSGIGKQYGNNPEAYRNALYGGGFVTQAQAYEKAQRDAEMAGAKLKSERLTGQKLQSELSESERIQAAQRIGALRGHPYEAVVQDMTNGLMDAVTAGKITQEEAEHKYAMMLQKIPRDQAGLDAFIDSTMLSVMTPQQQAEGRTKERDFRQKAAQDPFNADGAPNTAVQSYGIQKATAGATQNYGSPVVGVGPEGRPVFWQPSKGGGAPSIVPGVAPPPSKPVPPTGEENTAAGYLGRMKAAERLVAGLSGGESTEETSMAGAVPYIGDYVQRKMMNETQQKYKQAADDWIRAKLRKESGAVIADTEMLREYQTYFPQPGDMDGTIKQKAMARRQAEEQMIQSAGRAAPQQTEAPFTPAELDYIAKRRAAKIPDQEIALELQQGAATPSPKPPATLKAPPKKPVRFDADKERRYQEWKARGGR